MRRAPTTDPLRPVQAQREPSRVAAALTATGVLVGVVWVLEFVDVLGFGGRLDLFGIQPRNPATLGHIFTAPFMHAGFPHLLANTVPLAVLSFMSAARNLWRYLAATLVIVAVGGALVWLFGRGNSVHLGASELIFGYLGYLLGVGWWERTPVAIGVAVAAFLLYGGLIWGVFPSSPYVSWEGHLFGFLAGLFAALLLHGRRPGRPTARL